MLQSQDIFDDSTTTGHVFLRLPNIPAHDSLASLCSIILQEIEVDRPISYTGALFIATHGEVLAGYSEQVFQSC